MKSLSLDADKATPSLDGEVTGAAPRLKGEVSMMEDTDIGGQEERGIGGELISESRQE